MKINKLTLENFRCFAKYELSLSDRITLLIGNNGAGKTAILDALASTISEFLDGFPSDGNILEKDKRPAQVDDIRHEFITLGQDTKKERSAYTLLSAEGIVDNEEISWFFSIKLHSSFKQTDTSASIRNIAHRYFNKITEIDTYLPIIAYYGTGRLWKKIDDKELETLSPDSRLAGYRSCLNPASDLEQLFRWFKTQEIIALQKQEKRHTLEAVRNAIVEMIPEAKRAWWNFEWDQMFIETTIQDTPQSIPFHLLSDGYRNMIGMVADIAYRMATLNPQLEAEVIKQTEGIVLIDEIDLHLHPKWQREVVGRLLETFPKVQFVASSHSPFIIQSLYGREDCLLWDLEKEAPLSIESKSIEDIAENQQGVEIPQQSQRFLAMEKTAEEYYRVLKQIPPASDDEKQRLKQRLDELLLPFSDDPAFQAFLKMEREAALPTDELK
ncbi:AAA family ATPase [Methylomonas sp. LL1]|uniref:AAA family ATPase n=1 Tax=Methylomonas sp. LL1 TaxID=2785785 RepID=UPI0018C3B855|nr:AAA family ATPase [Methylomonas sp. LL1]QPK65117.1 AAA family ATPase [Methylomonas sp. LL1]